MVPSVLQEHHKLKYTDEALAACVKFASQYIQDRFLPDKASIVGAVVGVELPRQLAAEPLACAGN